MKKLKEWLNVWFEGKKVRGLNPTPNEIYLLWDIAYKKRKEFISAGILPILDKCGISYKSHGIGWMITD